MTLLEIDAKYAAALAKGATFGGHPAQLEAAAALYNAWPEIRTWIKTANEAVELKSESIAHSLNTIKALAERIEKLQDEIKQLKAT